MAIFLNERQVGFDTQEVGFPDIGACMGLAVQVAGGLFGFHIMPSETNKVPAFLKFFTRHLNTDTATHLYGCCRWNVRYAATGGRADWEQEMRAIATEFGYTGPVTGFNAAKGTSVDNDKAMYIALRRTGPAAVSFHYKRSSKMTYTKTLTDSATPDVRGILPKPGGGFKLSPKLAFGDTSAADLTVTKSNKGELHPVSSKNIVTFNIA